MTEHRQGPSELNRPQTTIDRRGLLHAAVTAGAATALAESGLARGDDAAKASTEHGERLGPYVDTNIHLFPWPFRRLPLDDLDALISKLRQLGIGEAWAGNFEGLLHRDVAGVNARTAEACRRHPELIPVGSINPTLPDWREDLRRCADEHGMSAIRLYPNYHGYRLDEPLFAEVLDRAAGTGLLVQIAAAMEDTRTQHRNVRAEDVDLAALPTVMQMRRTARVQILNARLKPPLLQQLAEAPGVYFDTARVDGTDGIAEMLRTVSAERVMLGTHAPLLIPDAALIRIHESDLQRRTLRLLLASNARRFAVPESRPPTREAARPMPTTGQQFGLPSPQQLEQYRIWDAYFTPSHSRPGGAGSRRILADMERSRPAIEKGHFEKLCYFPHVGLGTSRDREYEEAVRANSDLVLEPMRRWPDRLLGMIQLNAHDVRGSLEALDRWLGDGPMVGVYFPGGGPAALTCTHRNYDPLVERIGQLGGVIMQHTWFKTGGKQGPGESTPAEFAVLARRFPEQPFICAHAGGQWQRGIRAVREMPNVSIETSGFDATAGFVEMAVRELGSDRIVFGSHLPSRSLGTELGKIVGAKITERDRRRILGENFRDLLRPILRRN